jgi:hypothetical protein
MDSRSEPTMLSFVDRLPDPLGDDGRIFVQSEQHGPLEALWAGDDHPHSTAKWIGGNPSLVLLFDVPTSSFDSSFNPLAACGRDSLAVEDDQRHLLTPFRLTTIVAL